MTYEWFWPAASAGCNIPNTFPGFNINVIPWGVYDFVPEYSAYPYLSIGEINWADASGPAVNAAECTLVFRVFSRNPGRGEAAAIMARLHDLLHNANLSISGYTLVFMRFASGEITMETDGVTYAGVMRFQAFVQAR